MLDVNSSSANVSITVQDVLEDPSGRVKITLSDGKAFYTRNAYFTLSSGTIVSLFEISRPISEVAMEELYIAVRRYAVECKAIDYLNRAENSRFMLENKLKNKGFISKEIDPVLDFLENMKYINDVRFAGVWLRSRIRTKHEGRIKLLAGLYNKGISRECANTALDELFSNVEELELCQKALKNQLRRGLDKEKVFQSLIRKGFSFSMVKECFREID